MASDTISNVPRDTRELVSLADMLLRVSALASFQLGDGRLKELVHYLVHESGLEGSTLEAAVAFVVTSHQDAPKVPIDVIADLYIDAARMGGSVVQVAYEGRIHGPTCPCGDCA